MKNKRVRSQILKLDNFFIASGAVKVEKIGDTGICGCSVVDVDTDQIDGINDVRISVEDPEDGQVKCIHILQSEESKGFFVENREDVNTKEIKTYDATEDGLNKLKEGRIYCVSELQDMHQRVIGKRVTYECGDTTDMKNYVDLMLYNNGEIRISERY